MNASQPTILVLDDEKNIRQTIFLALSAENFRVIQCHDPASALRALDDEAVDVAIIDIRLGEIDGLSFYQKIQNQGFDLPAIFISGHATLSEAVKAVQMGAYDFLEKPFTAEKLTMTVKRCLEHARMRARLNALKPFVGDGQRMLGESRSMKDLEARIQRVAPTDSTVLVQGESGTGKELIATLIHENSARRDRAFIKVNCSAIPDSLLESELFGHEKGAFTGALATKRGFFELAHHGTIFLDEIGDLSPSAQAKVLRVLQSGEIQKVGSERILKINARVIAATHKNLAREVKDGRFREDLFYRINVVPLLSPALRERREDIPLLCQSFVNRFCERNGIKVKPIEPAALQHLTHYHWPGNIRELQNLMERLVILSGPRITVMDLPEELFQAQELPADGPRDGLSLKEFRDKTERDYVIDTLKKTSGNISKAAKHLRVERTYLHRRMIQLGIAKRDYFV